MRTEKNVLESDGTVVFTVSRTLSGGSKLTVDLAAKHGKPHLHLHKNIGSPAKLLIDFIQKHQIRRLNVRWFAGLEGASGGSFRGRRAG